MAINKDKKSKSSAKDAPKKDSAMTVLEHIVELRTRLIRSVALLFVAFILCFALSEYLLTFLSFPLADSLKKLKIKTEATTAAANSSIKKSVATDLQDYSCSCQNQKEATATAENELLLDCHCQLLEMQPPNTATEQQTTAQAEAQVEDKIVPFIFLDLTEVFIAKIKIAFWVALFLTIPYMLGEIWGFVAPAMYKNEKKIFLYIVLGSIICFVGGAIFGYSVVFPFGFDFFLGLGGEDLATPTISLDKYLRFSLMLLFAFGIVFELPVLCLILSWFGVITAPMMLKHSRVVIVIIFFIAAIFSPPDPLSMLLMGFPLVGLYFLSYLMIGLLKGFKAAK